ncbi:zinc transport system permease protein [Evansella caseinilytica]|uniref:Zinc transport system permease protein n=1 Tax=Evansella caseinilytica TaxID=1503961 RepID=A0A1H3KLR6_9BACI|nr:metal ABC transporter permease [Evansella caseinilytica]SDY53107.1 zinc transport system permease protein [Evansella caseinilytica]
MEWINQLTFLERGIIAGIVIGFLCPLLGAFLLVRRITIVSEALSHITLTGITAGVLMAQTLVWLPQQNPMYVGLLFSLIGSLFVEKLRELYKNFQELAIPIILSSGVGLSAILISLAKSSYTEWYNYLFGSIVTVMKEDLLFIVATGLVAFGLLFAFYKELLSISFDAEFAKVSGISVKKLNILFAVLIALVISMSMKVVGILLVGAMVTLPIAASIQLAKSFRQVIGLGILFGELSVLGGVAFSYHFGVATGGMIIIVGIILLIISVLIKKVFVQRSRFFSV